MSINTCPICGRDPCLCRAKLPDRNAELAALVAQLEDRIRNARHFARQIQTRTHDDAIRAVCRTIGDLLEDRP